MDEADPKLKEFLEVMQPASKSKNWAQQAVEDPTAEPPTKIQAIEIPEGESDEEYEVVPKKSRQKSPPKSVVPATNAVTTTQLAAIDEVMVDSTAPNTTDDDWLRRRTNRLLDLMDPDDIPAATSGLESTDADPVAETTAVQSEPDTAESMHLAEQDNEEEDGEKPDPVVEAIQSNGRLFVRNLPYAATEDDLRKHFEPYGPLEEVRRSRFHLFLPRFHDEYPDRDSLCLQACDVNWTKILVDASCFLKSFNASFRIYPLLRSIDADK